MAKNYSVEINNGIARVSFSSQPTLDEIKAATDELYEEFPCEKNLWALSGVNFDLSTEELVAIAKYSRPKPTKPNKIALFADDDLAYGELRQFAAHREQGDSQIQVFRNEEESITWLNKE